MPITFDLNDKTLTTVSPIGLNVTADTMLKNGKINSSKTVARASQGATLTINSGTYDSTSGVTFWAGGKDLTGNIVINDANVSGQEFAVGVGKDSVLTINGGTFVARDNAVIGGNGSTGYEGSEIIINGGTFTGNITSNGYIACGIYQPQEGELTLNGGTFNVNGGVGVLSRAGRVEINDGCTITTTGNLTGWVGDSKVKVNCSALYLDGASAYPGWTDESKMIVNGGTFTTDENVKTATLRLSVEDSAEQRFINSTISDEEIEVIAV